MAKVGHTLADRFELLEELGRGASGAVYRARDKLLDTQVCIKVLIEGLAGDADVVERFKRELLIARKVTHPGVCKSFDLQKDGEAVFLVMEYVDGENLNDRLDRQRPLPVDDAVQIIRGAAQALGAAHAAGVVHRDLKPANILVRPDGSVSVVDFGIAIATDMSKLTQPGLVLGSKKYVAPERWVGEEATPAVDVWSLGVILYGCLTGRLPYRGDGMFGVLDAIKTTTPDPPSVLRAEVPKLLDDIVFNALAKDPAARYPDANALDEALSIVDDAGAGWRPAALGPATSHDAVSTPGAPQVAPTPGAPAVGASGELPAQGAASSSPVEKEADAGVSEAETAERPLIAGVAPAALPSSNNDEAGPEHPDDAADGFVATAHTVPEQPRAEASITALPEPDNSVTAPPTSPILPPVSSTAPQSPADTEPEAGPSIADAVTAELELPSADTSEAAENDEDLFAQVPDRRGATQATTRTELVRGHKESSFPVARVIAVDDAKAAPPRARVPYAAIAALGGLVGVVLLVLLLVRAGDALPVATEHEASIAAASTIEQAPAAPAQPTDATATNDGTDEHDGADENDGADEPAAVDEAATAGAIAEDPNDEGDDEGDAALDDDDDDEGPEPEAWDFVDDDVADEPGAADEGDQGDRGAADEGAVAHAEGGAAEQASAAADDASQRKEPATAEASATARSSRKTRSRRASRPEVSADRNRYKSAARAAGRKMADRGLVSGDDPQLDSLRRKAARAAKRGAYGSAASTAEQALARAGEVAIDKALVSRKLKRLNTQYDRLQDASKRQQVAEAMRAARQPFAAQNWTAANQALNRAFKALR